MERRGGMRGRRVALAIWLAVGLPIGVAWVPAVADGPESTSVMVGAGGRVAVEPMVMPSSESVTRLVSREFLNEAERRALRVRYGCWTEADLADPALAARAALIDGRYGDAAFSAEGADPLDRAEACIRRGDLDRGLMLLGTDASARGAYLRTLAAIERGDSKGAIEASAGLAAMARDESADAATLVAAARGLMLRARVAALADDPASGYQEIMNVLGRVRDRLDTMSWEGLLAEAILLRDKGNPQEAGESLLKALSLNPRCAEAWHLLGLMAVDSMDFPRAERVAARLDELAGGTSDKATIGASGLGAMVVARARLRQGDPAGAVAILDEQVARQPSWREVLALRAAAESLRYDFPNVDALLTAFDEMSPGSPEAYFEVGTALAGARQYADASRYLEEAARRAPKWAEPVLELGLLEVQAGRDDKAREALEKAMELDSFNVRAKNSLKLVRDLGSFATVESAHFLVRYKPGEDEIVAKEMLAPLERIYARVTGDGPGGIRHEPTWKTLVELMPNHRWFSVRITGMPALHTIAAATGPIIAMEAPREGTDHLVGPYDWQRVVQHEFTHTVTLSRTSNRLPHWFTEASAVYLEDHPRDYNTVQLLTKSLVEEDLFDFESINIAFARPEKPSDRSLAYAQGVWMYEYMIERFGAEAPLKLMDLYASGKREPEAFREVLSVSREEFLEAFKAWAREQAISWGMIAGPGRETIEQLMDGAHEEAGKKAADVPVDAPVDVKVTDVTSGSESMSAESAEKMVDVATLRSWLEKDPTHPDVLKMLIDRLMDESKGAVTEEIKGLLERYAAARPVDPMPHSVLAKHLLDRGELSGTETKEAIAHLEFLDAREQHSPAYALELARLYATEGDLKTASARVERAVGIAPYRPSVREYAATIALRAGDLETAERHIHALTVLEPDREIHKKRLEAIRAKRAASR